jgi:3-phenylpropionate/cinnamic acid dioxygenase small subunit
MKTKRIGPALPAQLVVPCGTKTGWEWKTGMVVPNRNLFYLGRSEMRKWMGVFTSAIVAVLLILAISCKPAVNPVVNNVSSYADDRAQIEDLQARYLFALDFFDMDTYVSTFTEDGILDIVAYQAKGRAEIRKKLEESRPVFNPASVEAQGSYPPTGRHNITNIVLKIDGDKAVGRSYWFHYGNNNPKRAAALDGYGHYEDEMVKVNGKWLFAKRKIYNEGVEKWIAPSKNPCW